MRGEVESWSHALNVRELLVDMDVPVWIERSRSKGYHVWLFCGDWVSARWMRRLLFGACQAVGAPTKEVNPKSERLGRTSWGNFVRLPISRARSGHSVHQVIVDLLEVPIPLDPFVQEALEKSLTADRVAKVGKRPVRQPQGHTAGQEGRSGDRPVAGPAQRVWLHTQFTRDRSARTGRPT